MIYTKADIGQTIIFRGEELKIVHDEVKGDCNGCFFYTSIDCEALSEGVRGCSEGFMFIKSPRKSNLMTIEIEESTYKVKVIKIKGAKKGVNLPEDYPHKPAPAFENIKTHSQKGLLFCTHEQSREILGFNHFDDILEEGLEYTCEYFNRAVEYIKAAEKRLTEINRRKREEKPKRRTITI